MNEDQKKEIRMSFAKYNKPEYWPTSPEEAVMLSGLAEHLLEKALADIKPQPVDERYKCQSYYDEDNVLINPLS